MITATEAREDFNDERERTATLDYLRSAQQRYRTLAGQNPERLDDGAFSTRGGRRPCRAVIRGPQRRSTSRP